MKGRSGRSRRSGPILLDFSLVAPGGSTVHASGFLTALAARGGSAPDLLVALPADPSLLTAEARELEAAGVRTVRIGTTRPPGSLVSNLSGQVALPRLVRRERPSIVFVAREAAPLLLPRPYVLVAANLLRWRRLDELARADGRDLPRRPAISSLKSRVASLAVRRAQAVVAPSQVIADLLPPGTPTTVIPFGVDLEEAPPRTPPPAVAPPVRLVALGNLTLHKRIDVVIDLAAALVHEHGIDATLDLWGAARSDVERDRIGSHLASRLGARGRLRGYVEPAERRSVLVDADVLLLGSGAESFGFPLLEAMRTSTLVVAPDAPIARELGEGSALVYPEGDADTGARLLAPWLAASGRPDLEERLVTARDRAATFTWDRCVTDTLRLVREAGVDAERATGRTADDRTRSGPGRRRVALFQPVLAHYRIDLFNAFDEALDGGLTVFTVSAAPSSHLDGADDRLRCARRPARTWHLGPLWLVPVALREVWCRRWDVVVLSWNARQLEVLPALLVGRLRRTPVVLWGHGLGQGRSALTRGLRRTQARLATSVITYGEAGRRDVVELAPDQHVRVLQNTTGRPPPDPSPPPRPGHRLVYLGRLLAHKQVGRLLEAVSTLRREGLDLAVDIVGDGPERAALHHATTALDLDDRVEWHGQVTDWEMSRSLVQRGDLVVLPERAGLAVVDAFAASRAVVVTDDPRDNPPEAELVVHGVTGLRYSPPTVDALVDCLRRAYDHPALLAEMSGRAGQVYRDRLCLDVAAQVFSEVVEVAVGDEPPD